MYNRQVTVQWNANSEPDLAGYKMYVGSGSKHYDGPRTLTTTGTSQTVTGLDNGVT